MITVKHCYSVNFGSATREGEDKTRKREWKKERQKGRKERRKEESKEREKEGRTERRKEERKKRKMTSHKIKIS